MKNDTKKKHATKKKKLIIGIFSVILIFVVWIAGRVIYQIAVNGDTYRAKRIVNKNENIHYRTAEPEEFEEDIFADAAYLARNRDIKYISGAQSTEIALDETSGTFGAALPFFQCYFSCIINGAYEEYRTFFADSYFDKENENINYPYPENPFTKQKIYNISVDYRRAEDVIISDNEVRSYFIVKYMIKDNNGTFRPELDEETTAPLLFELTTIDDNISISKIVKYVG